MSKYTKAINDILLIKKSAAENDIDVSDYADESLTHLVEMEREDLFIDSLLCSFMLILVLTLCIIFDIFNAPYMPQLIGCYMIYCILLSSKYIEQRYSTIDTENL